MAENDFKKLLPRQHNELRIGFSYTLLSSFLQRKKEVTVKIVNLLLTFLVMLWQSPIVQAKQQKFWNQFGAKITVTTPDLKVNNMPLEVRDVPIHPDDKYALRSNAGPIKQKQYSTNGTLMFEMFWRNSLTEKVNFGLNINVMAYPNHTFYDNALRNYTNAVGTETRGYGAALTFVGIEKRSSKIDYLGLFVPELSLEFLSTSKRSLGGISVGYYQFDATNGWDRYDSLEVRKRYILAHIYPIGIYYKKGSHQTGIKLPVVNTTKLGDTADIEASPSVFYSWVFDSKKR